MRPIRTLVLATAVAALSTGAHASTLTAIKKGQFTYGELTLTGSQVMGETMTAYATAFDMEGGSATGTVPSDLLGRFVAWCLDVSSAIAKRATYDVNPDTVFGGFSVDTTAVQRYFDANFNETIHTDVIDAAAFQVGLWQTIYTPDEFSYSVTNESFRDKVDAFVSAGTNYGEGRVWSLTYLENTTGGQSLVTATPIPLPATGLLMLGVMGLGGIGVVARRRRDKAA